MATTFTNRTGNEVCRRFANGNGTTALELFVELPEVFQNDVLFGDDGSEEEVTLLLNNSSRLLLPNNPENSLNQRFTL